MSQLNQFPFNLPPINHVYQLIQYRQNQIDYYRNLIEQQHAQQQRFHQFQRQIVASEAMAQFNESFEKSFPRYRPNQEKPRDSVDQQDVNEIINVTEIENQGEEEDSQLKCETQSLKCPIGPDCTQHFTTKAKLDYHLEVYHRTFQYRCLLKNCNQSFSNSQTLNQHFQTVHPLLTSWQCNKCTRTYQSHAHLQYHFRSYHQSGKFACSYPDCTFIGQYRSDVYTHYEQRHQTYHCNQPNCDKFFRKTVHLKTHQRVHLGIKPYKCKWSGCLYASEDRSNTIKHIRIMHLKLPITKKEQKNKKIVDNRNAKDYLEVVKSLL